MAISSKRDPSKCHPWKEEEFFARVASFSIKDWFGKDSRISPLACARYGWICCGKDMLGCQFCNAHLCVEVPTNMYSSTQVDNIESAYAEKIKTAHEHTCPWQGNPSPAEFCHVPTKHRLVLDDHKKYAESWKLKENDTSEEKEGYINQRIRQYPLVSQSALGVWNEALDGQNSESVPKTVPEMLACFGWSKGVKSYTSLIPGAAKSVFACCKYCNRKVFLKDFQTDSELPSYESDSDENKDDDGPPGLGAAMSKLWNVSSSASPHRNSSSGSGIIFTPQKSNKKRRKSQNDLFTSAANKAIGSIFSPKLAKPALYSPKIFGQTVSKKRKLSEPANSMFSFAPGPRYKPPPSTSSSSLSTPAKVFPPLSSSSSSTPSSSKRSDTAKLLHVPLSQLHEGKTYPYKRVSVSGSQKKSIYKFSPPSAVTSKNVGGGKKSPMKRNRSRNLSSSEGGAKKRKIGAGAKNGFDCIREHRYFCPWVSPMPNDQAQTGWTFCLNAIQKQKDEEKKLFQADNNKPCE